MQFLLGAMSFFEICLHFCFFLFFSLGSGAVFLAICCMSELKFVMCCILELKSLICTLFAALKQKQVLNAD